MKKTLSVIFLFALLAISVAAQSFPVGSSCKVSFTNCGGRQMLPQISAVGAVELYGTVIHGQILDHPSEAHCKISHYGQSWPLQRPTPSNWWCGDATVEQVKQQNQPVANLTAPSSAAHAVLPSQNINYLSEGFQQVFIIGNKEYEVQVLVISKTAQNGKGSVKFRVNGEITEELSLSNSDVLADGRKITVASIITSHPSAVGFYFDEQVTNTGYIEQIAEQVSNAIPPVYGRNQPLTAKGGSDLSQFPEMFLTLNGFDANFVVGDQAPGSHVVAAVDIIQFLQKIAPNTQIGAARLASEISDIGNMIVIGDACSNPITKKVSGKSDCHYGLEEGQGAIELFNVNGKTQIIVAGYDETETRVAARSLANWQKWQGRSFIVIGDLSSPKIIPTNAAGESEPIAVDVSMTPPMFPIESESVMEFYTGWNLVTPSGRVVKFGKNDCDKKPAAFVFLANEQKYVDIKEAANILGNDFGEYLANNALWVYSYGECSQDIVVEKQDPKLRVVKGWNMLPNVALSCAVEKEYWWDAKRQVWSNEELSVSSRVVKASDACEE